MEGFKGCGAMFGMALITMAIPIIIYFSLMGAGWLFLSVPKGSCTMTIWVCWPSAGFAVIMIAAVIVMINAAIFTCFLAGFKICHIDCHVKVKSSAVSHNTVNHLDIVMVDSANSDR